MKYFGEYLVAKGIITEEGLVAALIDQIRTLPSIAEIAFAKKMIPVTGFLHALKLQSERRIDFRQACLELQLWTNEIEEGINRELKEVRIPLGQILINNGLSDLSTITKALDEFLSKIEAPIAVVKAPSTSAEAIDPVFLDQFLTSLNESKLTEIENLLNGMEILADNPVVLKEVMKTLLAEAHFVRGLMTSIRAAKFEGLVAKFETFCTAEMRALEAGQLNLALLMNLGGQLIGILREFSKSLMTSSSEGGWLSVEENSSKFDALIAKFTATGIGES